MRQKLFALRHRCCQGKYKYKKKMKNNDTKIKEGFHTATTIDSFWAKKGFSFATIFISTAIPGSQSTMCQIPLHILIKVWRNKNNNNMKTVSICFPLQLCVFHANTQSKFHHILVFIFWPGLSLISFMEKVHEIWDNTEYCTGQSLH